MRNKQLRILLVSLLVFVVLAALAGCRPPARKPLPPRTPAPTRPAPMRTTPAPPAPAPARQPMPTRPADIARLQDKLATEAEKVPGVKRAWVALSGTTALVGAELKSDVPRGQGDAAGLKNDIATRLRRAEPRLTGVAVATDAATITRVRRIAEGIRAGKPVNTFTRDLNDLMRRMAPGVK
ncbi:MAG TPA: YhcN/YlaJ family sporulation lipoprotein [Firmicutes bacterium]|nr:YhcN/YlaJ family sporulation lipoprotein [Bacillota bacterium]